MNKFFFLIFVFFISTGFAERVHPYHVGSVELVYQPKSQTFEGTGRFFIDDVEKALSLRYGQSYQFNKEAFEKKNEVAIQRYIAEYLKLKVNGNFIKINFVGYEEDKESVVFYFESEKVASPKKIETAISLLYNLYDDQLNIVHIVVGGQRKTDRLSYPNRYLYQQF